MRGRLLLFLVAVLQVTCVCAEITVAPWAPLYRGIDITRGTADASDGRAQVVTAIRVDLSDPTIRFASQDGNGNLPQDVVSQTAVEFLQNSSAQVVVNTSFYTPCCSSAPQDKDIIGLAVTEGQLVSPAQSEARAALLIDTLNQASFVNTTTDDYSLSMMETAFAGSNFILGSGRDIPTSADTIHPARTLVGLGDRNSPGDNQLLYMVTIDDGIPTSGGATRLESAQWMMRLGAHTAINLDGGGSTTMVAEDPQSGAVVRLNESFSNRSNANHLGILALDSQGKNASQFTPVWFAGLPDNAVNDFSPESGTANSAPGSASALDDDYYFAGTYPEPIGILPDDESLENLERAVIRFDPPNDETLRFHFNLDPEQLLAGAEFRYMTSVFQQDGAGSRSVELEMLFNDTVIDTTHLTEGQPFTSATFTALDVHPIAGDNVLTIRQIGGDARWTSFDFHRLDWRPVPEPTSARLWLITLLPCWRRHLCGSPASHSCRFT